MRLLFFPPAVGALTVVFFAAVVGNGLASAVVLGCDALIAINAVALFATLVTDVAGAVVVIVVIDAVAV